MRQGSEPLKPAVAKSFTAVLPVKPFVSQCKTFCFTVQNLLFRSAKPFVSQCKTFCFTVQNLLFHSTKPFVSQCKTFCFTVQNISNITGVLQCYTCCRKKQQGTGYSCATENVNVWRYLSVIDKKSVPRNLSPSFGVHVRLCR